MREASNNKSGRLEWGQWAAKIVLIFILWSLLLVAVVDAFAQIHMSNGVYVQNFNSLTTNSASRFWTNNVTLPGWYASRTTSPGVVTNYRAADGTTNIGSLYSFGSSGAADRALGSIASGGATAGTFAFGARLTNDSGAVQSNFLISFTGEQWRNGGANLGNTLSFSYATGNGAMTNADAANANAWITITNLDFQSPVIGTNAVGLDGNLATNQNVFTNIPMPGLVLNTNEELFLRWRDVDDASADQGLGIDDLKLSFAPINDAFAQAIPLTGNSNRIVSSSIGATREPGEPDHGSISNVNQPPNGIGSLWWDFLAPTNGTIELDSRGSSFQPIMAAYKGDALTNLATVSHNNAWAGGSSAVTRLMTRIRFDVRAGQMYHIAVDGVEQGAFSLVVLFIPAAANDNFASRLPIFPPVTTIYGSSLGATVETNEPAHLGFQGANHSVWWTWTPVETGSYIVTTFGSRFDTTLDFFDGNSLETLVSPINNDDGFLFPDGGLLKSLQDSSSRLRFEAVANTPCQIAIAGGSAGIGTARGSGDYQLNFTTLAIEDIISLSRTNQDDGSMSFSANLKISNFRLRTTGTIRVRLVAKAFYRVSPLFKNDLDFVESLNTPDRVLGTNFLAPPGYFIGTNSVQMVVTGVCATATGNTDVRTNWCAYAILEEMAGGVWNLRDTRLIAPQYYNYLTEAAGGGVVTLSSGGSTIFPFGCFRIQLEPAAALATNGGWKILQLTDSAYYRDGETTYGLPAATNYILSFLPASGFLTPSDRTLSVVANQTNALTITYTNIVPVGLTPGLSNGVAQPAFSAPTGQRYAIERSTNLTAWVTLITNTVGTNGVLRVNDSNLTNGLQRAFYRARYVP